MAQVTPPAGAAATSAAGTSGRRRRSRPALEVAGTTVRAGRRATVEIPVARLPTGTFLSLPVAVVHGRDDGPTVWLSAAVHGDELNGIEIIRRVLRRLDPRSMAGTVLAVPIVNVFGFINESRYLPDRRDLNRSFPGSPRGSLAARLAHLFITTIVERSTHGIDLHTGSDHRTNLPQVRGDLDDPETRRLMEAFGTPVMIASGWRDGSLRETAAKRGIPIVVYEGGEAHRFDRFAIDAGYEGVMRVLAALRVVDDAGAAAPPPVAVRATTWVRARRSGILRLEVDLGDRVTEGQVLGWISDAFGVRELAVRAPLDGLVIGMTRHPLVAQGEAVAHIADVSGRAGRAARPPT